MSGTKDKDQKYDEAMLDILMRKKVNKTLDLFNLMLETLYLKESTDITNNLENDPQIKSLRKGILLIELEEQKSKAEILCRQAQRQLATTPFADEDHHCPPSTEESYGTE
ncbi:hypothetical protein CMI37_37540 [Candidatus Pacearchaeota archaeon]|nr:hypothetical protein [Candidatus Pacearchaeota archaeon]|tara:strand:+ start:1437 stop:1766 length:330 start_codon:yes stop_codon:yes gene_type:complete